ncbi:MAG: RagB/SusD family nutrient uptake outer membrane protein [Chitinophagaceae bacterium]|nr:MAG: RagB/SusD family nutrient uptake outer membrane protein [Chitinophagaceae bacterium]
MKRRLLYTALLAGLGMAACKKSFTDRPALDAATADTYYNSPEQVRGATGTLYGMAWFDFVDKAMDAIGDVRSGNEFTWDNQFTSFKEFTTTATDARLSEAWNSLYKVAGWSNVLIKTLEYKKLNGNTAAYIDQGIAEARFIRGAAYFYIGRIWGDAPIVTDPGAMAQAGTYQVPRYLKKDVLRFALEDFRFAEGVLPEADVKGRVTKFSAKGMMAKLYLYRKDYDSAKLKAGEVIASGKYDLFPNYGAMFTSSVNNNNIESLFALQHELTSEWGTQNSLQAYRAPGNLLMTGDGWSSVVPSLDILAEYESGDLRKKGSVMTHGNVYPDWKPTRDGNATFNTFMANGFRYDTTEASPIGIKTPSRANIAKYVVGPGSATEPVLQMKTKINTYILRYADVLLIYAEAVLGENASTSDAQALSALNRVRLRAGLTPKSSITKDDILHERRVEFAFEGDYWYDITRQGYAKARQLIEAQNRGYKNDNGTETVVRPTFSENQMQLPIPLGELTQNPLLSQPPVPYY